MSLPSPRLPRAVQRILERLGDYEELFAVTRDFEIVYADVARRRGRIAAFFWLVGGTLQVSLCYLTLSLKWRLLMFRNYIKSAFRQLKKQKSFSLINILGLAIGMTACLLMLMYVVNESSYEDFHVRRSRIHRVIVDWSREGSRMRFAGAMPAIAPAMREEFPEVETAARVRPVFKAMLSARPDQSIREENAYYMDPEILDIMSFELLQGDRASALADPFSVVLSRTTATKYFGNEDPMNQTLRINDKPYKVTGVMADLPANTHLRAEIFVSYATAVALGEYPQRPWTTWGDDYNYVLLREGAAAADLEPRLQELVGKNAGEWFIKQRDLVIQPMGEIHWDTVSRGDIGTKGNRLYVYLFLSASFLVLLIACFNFMNLSTSRYMDRIKEVGIRKVVGAERKQLIHQFLVESVVVALIAVGIGLLLFQSLFRVLYSYLDLEIVLGSRHFLHLYGIMALLVLFVGLFAGGYPALFLSRFRPVNMVKGTTAGLKRGPSFRPALVVVQYAVSILLILGSITIFQQIDFMKNSDLGFEKEDVVLIRFPFDNPDAKTKYPVLRDQFKTHPGVLGVTGAYTVPGINSQFQMSLRKAGADPGDQVSLQVLPADFDYVRSLGLHIVEGRDLSEDHAVDLRESILLNQTAVKLLGYDQALGQKLIIPRENQAPEMTVVGVVEDFHVKSLHNPINPMIIYIEPRMYGVMAVKLRPGNQTDVLAFLEKTWTQVLPDAAFSPRYMEDAYFSFYRTEEKTGRLIAIFTGLALFISCLGLFGLASFMTARRVKEIGIRKVLGASTGGLTVMLSRQFARWVLLSILCAAPIAYWLLTRWLENFAYRIELGPAPFLVSGAIVILIAVATVSFQSIKAAYANPVDSLRSE